MAKNTRNKFMVGAVTAAMVATAVAPVAGAQEVKPNADVSYSDVSPDSSHFPFIYKALDYKIMTGYADNTFKPTLKLTRGQVVKALGKYVVAASGKQLSEFDLTGVTPFNDVPSSVKDQELYTFSLIVKQAGIFRGDNNNLNASQLITREQMSQVLVKAFDLKDLPGDLSKVTDNASANAQYRGYIDILSENGVTSESAFRPKENTNRAQFATFLVRAYELANPPVTNPDPELPEVIEEGLNISFAKTTLAADGKDNTVVTFTVTGADGKADPTADDIVLGLDATYGSFANKTVTVQNGVATVVLTSEQSNKAVQGKVTATVVEAGEGHKDLIGKVSATAYFNLVVNDGSTEVLNLTGAESNQADRATLHFDKAVELSDFVQTTNAEGALLYQARQSDGTWGPAVTAAAVAGLPAVDVRHALKAGALTFTQDGNTPITILGLKPVAGDNKSLEVIFEKVNDLDNNKAVNVAARYVSDFGRVSNSSTSFTLTDARTPEATAVTNQGMKTVAVKFSEAIDFATFKVDATSPLAGAVRYGEFDVRTLEDTRDMAYITTAAYLTAGQHKVEVSSPTDFAGNVGATQNLNFTVAANTTTPTATAVVQSPEQFRVTFNTPVDAVTNGDFEMQRYDEANDTWVAATNVPLAVQHPTSTEAVIELTQDWTVIYNTSNTNKNYYNDKYRLVFTKGALVNTDNGLTNDRFVVDLSAAGSALTTPDTVSPSITSIEATNAAADSFIVTASEPIKLAGKDNAGSTLSQQQAATGNTLPEAKVQFLGTDADGKPATVNGNIGAYTDTNDSAFYVAANQDLQALVDAGYSEDWTIVVSQLTDDVGNTATTTTKAFKVAKTVVNPDATPFEIQATSATVNTDGSGYVVIDFTEGIQFTGENDATDIENYTLNGKDLPATTSFTKYDLDNNLANGYETVVITLPAGALSGVSNVINVKRDLVSYDGSVLRGSNEVVIPTTAQ